MMGFAITISTFRENPQIECLANVRVITLQVSNFTIATNYYLKDKAIEDKLSLWFVSNNYDP